MNSCIAKRVRRAIEMMGELSTSQLTGGIDMVASNIGITRLNEAGVQRIK